MLKVDMFFGQNPALFEIHHFHRQRYAQRYTSDVASYVAIHIAGSVAGISPAQRVRERRFKLPPYVFLSRKYSPSESVLAVAMRNIESDFTNRKKPS